MWYSARDNLNLVSCWEFCKLIYFFFCCVIGTFWRTKWKWCCDKIQWNVEIYTRQSMENRFWKSLWHDDYLHIMQNTHSFYSRDFILPNRKYFEAINGDGTKMLHEKKRKQTQFCAIPERILIEDEQKWAGGFISKAHNPIKSEKNWSMNRIASPKFQNEQAIEIKTNANGKDAKRKKNPKI